MILAGIAEMASYGKKCARYRLYKAYLSLNMSERRYKMVNKLTDFFLNDDIQCVVAEICFHILRLL